MIITRAIIRFYVLFLKKICLLYSTQPIGVAIVYEFVGHCFHFPLAVVFGENIWKTRREGRKKTELLSSPFLLLLPRLAQSVTACRRFGKRKEEGGRSRTEGRLSSFFFLLSFSLSLSLLSTQLTN